MPVPLSARGPPGSPPAIWAAFARASAWKSWVIAIELAVIVLLVLANARLARTEPDVVLISPDGKSTYLQRSIAGEALRNFLAEQKGQPPDVAVVHFTVEFLKRFLALNSSTIREAWPEALAQMAPGLREKLQREAEAQKLVPMLEAAQVRTEIAVEDVTLVERTQSLLHVRATVRRTRSRLADGASPTSDAVQVDLVEKILPRTAARPDGLEIVEARLTQATPPAAAGTQNPPP